MLRHPYGEHRQYLEKLIEHYPDYVQAMSVQDYLDSVQPFILLKDSDVFLFEVLRGGAVLGHFFCQSRGKKALFNARQALTEIMKEVNVVIGFTPIDNHAARWFTRKLGFRSNGLLDDPVGTVEFFSLTKQEWNEKYG